jgi:hypothetical protein
MASLSPKKIQDLLACAALSDECTVETPMELSVYVCSSNGDHMSDSTRNCYFIGSLVYHVVTYQDISYLVYMLSQFVSAPTMVHYSYLSPCSTISLWHDLSPHLHSLF